MQIDKSQILELLRSQGNHDQAQAAEQNLPDQVDTDQHAGLLASHGIDIQQLMGMLGGGGGGLGGALGGLTGGGQDQGEGEGKGKGGGGLGGLLGG